MTQDLGFKVLQGFVWRSSIFVHNLHKWYTTPTANESLFSDEIKTRTNLTTCLAYFTGKHHLHENLFRLIWKNLESYTRGFTVVPTVIAHAHEVCLHQMLVFWFVFADLHPRTADDGSLVRSGAVDWFLLHFIRRDTGLDITNINTAVWGLNFGLPSLDKASVDRDVKPLA